MEGEAILQTTAEVSVALAGFTGVVAAFGQRRGQWSATDTLRFKVMLSTSLSALMFSILPFAVHHLGAVPTTTWGISSALLAAFFLIMLPVNTRGMHRLGAARDASFNPWIPVFGYSLATLAVVGQVLNTLDIGFHRAFGPYFLGLCCLLLMCAIMFIRLLSFVGQEFEEE